MKPLIHKSLALLLILAFAFSLTACSMTQFAEDLHERNERGADTEADEEETNEEETDEASRGTGESKENALDYLRRRNESAAATTAAPETAAPETAAPATAAPETAAPETAAPATAAPETSATEITAATTAAPETTATTTAAPETTAATTAAPETTAATTAAPETTAAPAELPLYLPSNLACSQYILVEAQGSQAQLTLYAKSSNGWIKQTGFSCQVGKNGVKSGKKEGDGCTPAGEFHLLFCMGTKMPDTKFTYRNADKDLLLIEDSTSAFYNTLQPRNLGGRDWSDTTSLYDMYFANNRVNYLIFFDFNGDCLNPATAVRGNGSSLFLSGLTNASSNVSTGDIMMSASDMLVLLSYLDSALNPEVIITSK